VQGGTPQLHKVRPRMTTTTNDSAIAAALDGFGLTRVLSYQVADHLQAGRLATVLVDCEPAALPVHVVHREGKHPAQRVRAFLDLVVERLRSSPALN
jgi:DNA-binding transcriptional LysR family regulator